METFAKIRTIVYYGTTTTPLDRKEPRLFYLDNTRQKREVDILGFQSVWERASSMERRRARQPKLEDFDELLESKFITHRNRVHSVIDPSLYVLQNLSQKPLSKMESKALTRTFAKLPMMASSSEIQFSPGDPLYSKGFIVEDKNRMCFTRLHTALEHAWFSSISRSITLKLFPLWPARGPGSEIDPNNFFTLKIRTKKQLGMVSAAKLSLVQHTMKQRKNVTEEFSEEFAAILQAYALRQELSKTFYDNGALFTETLPRKTLEEFYHALLSAFPEHDFKSSDFDFIASNPYLGEAFASVNFSRTGTALLYAEHCPSCGELRSLNYHLEGLTGNGSLEALDRFIEKLDKKSPCHPTLDRTQGLRRSVIIKDDWLD